MSIYSDKLAHLQVVINSWYSVAQMCTREDMLTQYLGMPYLYDVMSHNELTTQLLVKLILEHILRPQKSKAQIF